MPALLIISIVFFIGLLADRGWSIEERLDHIPPQWSSTLRSQTSAEPVQTQVYQTNVTRISYTSSVILGNVRDRSLDTDQPHTPTLLASTTSLKGAFKTKAEKAHNQRESRILVHDDSGSRMTRIGFTASSSLARYGMTHRRAGQDLFIDPYQDRREVLGKWRNGLTPLHGGSGQQWNNNNMDEDSGRARLEQNYGRMGFSWNQASLPSLAITYSQSAPNSTLDSTVIAPQKMSNHTLEAALGYSGVAWHVGLASSYVLGTDLFRNGSGNRVHMQTVTTSLRPLDTLTIGPTLGYRTEQQDWSGVRIDSSSAGLAMHYQQSQRLLFSAMGNYSGKRSSDRLVDLETIGGKGILTVELQQLRGWNTKMSVEGSYNQHTNRAMSAMETQDISGLLRFVLAPL
jgi:hypothetical protein